MDSPRKQHLYDIIFEADTRAGKAFDVVLLILILASIVTVMLESVGTIRADHGGTLTAVEWIFTGLFTIEYLLRLYCVRRPMRYALSFFGVVDILAILPTYLSLVFGGAHSLVVIRALRLLRVFRVFKLARFLGEASQLSRAIRSSIPKLTIFLVAVVTVVVIIGTSMYLVEGQTNPGFENIPISVYWAIVTVTTVGFGDSVPVTPLGRALASLLMVIGFAMLAVPTGIMTAEIVHARTAAIPTTQVCPDCLQEGHETDAVHCKFCGTKL
jgi:voltage-gated potassium channel